MISFMIFNVIFTVDDNSIELRWTFYRKVIPLHVRMPTRSELLWAGYSARYNMRPMNDAESVHCVRRNSWSTSPPRKPRWPLCTRERVSGKCRWLVPLSSCNSVIICASNHAYQLQSNLPLILQAICVNVCLCKCLSFNMAVSLWKLCVMLKPYYFQWRLSIRWWTVHVSNCVLLCEWIIELCVS